MRVPAGKKAQGTRRRRRCEGVGEVAGEGRMAGGMGTNDGLIYTTKESAETREESGGVNVQNAMRCWDGGYL